MSEKTYDVLVTVNNDWLVFPSGHEGPMGWIARGVSEGDLEDFRANDNLARDFIDVQSTSRALLAFSGRHIAYARSHRQDIGMDGHLQLPASDRRGAQGHSQVGFPDGGDQVTQRLGPLGGA